MPARPAPRRKPVVAHALDAASFCGGGGHGVADACPGPGPGAGAAGAGCGPSAARGGTACAAATGTPRTTAQDGHGYRPAARCRGGTGRRGRARRRAGRCAGKCRTILVARGRGSAAACAGHRAGCARCGRRCSAQCPPPRAYAGRTHCSGPAACCRGTCGRSGCGAAARPRAATSSACGPRATHCRARSKHRAAAAHGDGCCGFSPRRRHACSVRRAGRARSPTVA